MTALSLFLHSTGTGPWMWFGVPDEVTAGTTVLAPPHLGYPPAPPLGRDETGGALADVRHVLAQIPDGARDIHVYAHSYGGVVALQLLPALGARVRSLFLYEPVLFGALANDGSSDPAAAAEVQGFAAHPWFLHDPERGGTEPWLETFIDYWNRPGAWARMTGEPREQTLRLGWKMFHEVRSCFFDVRSFDEHPLPEVPCSIVMGERSPKASRAVATTLARRHPWARLVELPRTGHMGPLTHPPVVHEAMLAHRKRVLGAGSEPLIARNDAA